MHKKFIKVIIPFLIIISTSFSSVYALDCELGAENYAAPLPSQIFCPFVKIFNLSLLLVGVVLLAMIIFGAIKMATALGDPKGLQGAHLTWTYAVVGTFVVLGSFAFIAIINKLFGLGIKIFEGGGLSGALFSKMQDNIEGFLNSIFVYEQ